MDNGWLSPNGRFSPCYYGEHEELASRICKWEHVSGNSERLEKLKYAKLQSGIWAYSWIDKLSQKQYDYIWDWCQNLPDSVLKEENLDILKTLNG